MAKFAKIDRGGELTTNKAGGQAFTLSDNITFVFLVLTTFLKDKYYETETEQIQRLQDLITRIPDKEFIAKVAIFARNEFGLRSVSHLIAAELALQVKDQKWLKYAIKHIIRRPDDMYEIVAYYRSKRPRKEKRGLSAALRKGIALALEKFDEYSLAKYRGTGSVKLVDIFNLVHPKPATDYDKELWSKVIKDEIRSTETWEAKISQAGKEEDVEDAKEKAWADLIDNKKLGYFALLRNLRNIMEQAPEHMDKALAMLTDPELIKGSLVLPFRYMTAYDEIVKLNKPDLNKILWGISKAVDVALGNMPHFIGKTMVAIDTSGSMNGKPLEHASMFGAALFKSNPLNTDLLIFSDKAGFITMNPNDSLISLAGCIKKVAFNGGTDFNQIFNVTKAYDRIIILSDMQAWIGSQTPYSALFAYKARANANPLIYSVDLQGYGSTQFSPVDDKIFMLAGFSEKIFDIMKLVEQDRDALLNKINSIKI